MANKKVENNPGISPEELNKYHANEQKFIEIAKKVGVKLLVKNIYPDKKNSPPNSS